MPDRNKLIRFLVVGMVNTAFGYGLFTLFVLMRIDSAYALALATVGGVIFNFFTTGRFVFQSRNHRLLPRFIGAYVLTYSVNLLLLRTLEDLLVPTLIAQALCLPPIVVLSFILFQTFVFRNKPT